MWYHIYSTIGFAPPQPPKSRTNLFLLYLSDHWNARKHKFDARNRTLIGKVSSAKMRRDESEEEKAPYHERTKTYKEADDRAFEGWRVACREWERQTWKVKDEWIQRGNAFEDWPRKRKRMAWVEGGISQGAR